MPDRQRSSTHQPDWQQIVRERLVGLSLNPAELDEVRAEISLHLEESYEAFRAQGLSESDALQRTLRQIGNSWSLRHGIALARNGGHPMKNRLHQIWIPGLLNFVLFTVLLIPLRQIPFQPRLVFSYVGYLPWLLPLLCLGALAAYLSSRAGGSRSAALLASVLPVLGLGFAFLFMFPAGFFVEHVIGQHVDFRNVSADFLSAPIVSLLVPALALLAGALSLQFLLSRRPTPTQKTVA